MWIILCNVVLICGYQIIAFAIMWYYMCIIFCEIVLCLLKSEEHEIEEKRMCFEKCFLEFKKKKNVSNNFYEKWDKILFFGTIMKEKKMVLTYGEGIPIVKWENWCHMNLNTPFVWWRYNDTII